MFFVSNRAFLTLKIVQSELFLNFGLRTHRLTLPADICPSSSSGACGDSETFAYSKISYYLSHISYTRCKLLVFSILILNKNTRLEMLDPVLSSLLLVVFLTGQLLMTLEEQALCYTWVTLISFVSHLAMEKSQIQELNFLLFGFSSLCLSSWGSLFKPSMVTH